MRRERIRHKQATISRIQKAGIKVAVLDKTIHHYRLTGPRGGVIDFWVSTERWMVPHLADSGGHGVDAMLEAMADLEPTAAAKIKGAGWDGVVIFADASWKDGHGGWAGKIYGSGEPRTCSGGFLSRVPSSHEAETRAIANSIAYGLCHGLIRKGQKVMIQSDCQFPLSGILATVPKSKDSPALVDGEKIVALSRVRKALAESEGLKAIVKFAANNGLELITRWVRGHNSAKGDGRNKINAEVDRLAGKHRKAVARNALTTKEATS